MFNFLKKLRGKSYIPVSARPFGAFGGVSPLFGTEDYLQAYADTGWWHAVVFRIALGLSEVQWTLFDTTNKGKPTQVYDHPVLDLLHLCNPFQTSEELIALDTIYMESLGESFWVLNYNAQGEPAEIVLAYPNLMTVVPDKNFPFVKGYLYGSGPNPIPLDANEVIHFKYPNPLNQYRGLGQASAIGVNLSAERNADRWVDNFFYNSARPDGVIQFDYNLSDEQFNKLKEQWAEKYRGVSKAHQVALLEGGGKYIQVQNTVKDMDFPNLKQKNRDIILGIEGMPLSVLGISENVNLANAEAGDYTFARWIVKPRLDWKKAKLQEQLLPKFKNSKNLKLGFEEIVPETAEQKRLDAESGMRAGYLTVNEARIATGKDPLPGDVGDVLLLSLNLIPTPIKEPIESPARPSLADDEEEPEQERQVVLRNYTQERKDEIWNRFAQKTLRQEESFKRVFGRLLDEQERQVISALEQTGKLPDDLNDEQTAKRFEPVIEMVYASGFDDALPKQVDLLDQHALEWIAARSLLLAKSVNQTTLEALRKELQLGFTAGESIQQLTKRIAGYFDTAKKWQAERVARTEVIAGSNAGALYRYEQAGITKKEWLSARDERTRETHSAADGQIVGIKDDFVVGGDRMQAPGQGFDPSENINCRCHPGDTLVRDGRIQRAYRRWYEGNFVEVITAKGYHLTGTPNHPILTDSGWTSLGGLREGNYVISRTGQKGMLSINPDVYDMPTPFSEIYDALALLCSRIERINALPMDFHGDGRQGQIDIITLDNALTAGEIMALFQHFQQLDFAPSHTQMSFTSGNRSLCGILESNSISLTGGARCNPCLNQPMANDSPNNAQFTGEMQFRFSRQIAGNQIVRGRHNMLPGGNLMTLEKPIEDGGVNVPFSHELLRTFTGLIAPDKVVSIRYFPFTGHVYNLQTIENWYSANNIISHNCTILAVLE